MRKGRLSRMDAMLDEAESGPKKKPAPKPAAKPPVKKKP